MKAISLNRQVLVLLISFFLTPSSFSQLHNSSRHITRGGDTAEIYISCQWYADANYITWNGIFHSTDNGQSLSVQRKTNWLVECGNIYGDSMSGALFQIPFHSQDTFAISYDYGKTFEPKYFHIVPYSVAGCMAGETYTSSWGLYRGTDYGTTFTLQSIRDSLTLQEVGTLPGEVYCYKGPPMRPLGLAYSNDYGQNFTVSFINIPGIPLYDECDLQRGTQPGELFFVIWKNVDTVALFHSFDYGQTLTFQSYMLYTRDELLYTAGRTPGTFYYVRRVIGGTPPCLHSYLWIYFSRDYGVTFTTYYHDLDSTFTGVSSKVIVPELKIYPNHATNIVTFRFGGELPDCDSKITLYDLIGKPVAEGILPKGQLEITLDTRKLEAGLYCYGIISNKYAASSNTPAGVSQATLHGKILITR